MKVDKIIKNAKVFTSAAVNYHASAFAVKDGKFVYVGDEEGLKDYEGEVVDLGGKFVMPGIIDAHVHIPMSVALHYSPAFVPIEGDNKAEILAFIRNYVAENPGKKIYKFMLPFFNLHGEKLTCWDLDEICPTTPVVIMEAVGHSGWANSVILRETNTTDDVVDLIPELSAHDKDENGHLTGFGTEGAFQPWNFTHVKDITDAQIHDALKAYMDFCVKMGITCVFEAGTPEAVNNEHHVLSVLCDMDRAGEIPVTIESSYMIHHPRELDGACIDILDDFDKKYNTEHIHCRIMKLIMDGIESTRTAAVFEPYDDGTRGGVFTDAETLSKLIVKLNERRIDFHVHTVGERAVNTVLNAVELAQQKIGGKQLINITLAHLGIVRDEDILRFAPLGVIADYTPVWHGGESFPGGVKAAVEYLGEKRGRNLNKSGMMWRTGAIVTFSSDNCLFGDFSGWSPYHGMEVGISRKDVRLAPNGDFATADLYPPECECMTAEQMILGYTINGAKQIHLEKTKGSIEVGKDADFLVLKENLLEIPAEGMRNIVPEEVFFKGKKMN